MADLAAARSLAAVLPDLMIEAGKVAGTVLAGWHGRRRPGAGEDFWQFRPLAAGESMRAVDWRRSARETALYVRERERQNAHTVWLWADLSPSMAWRSPLAAATKRDRAVLLTLALAELAARAGERIGLIGDRLPVSGRRSAEFLARKLGEIGDGGLDAGLAHVRRHHDVVLVGDFLGPPDIIAGRLGRLAASGARVQLVDVVDPAEESFPFAGRTEFVDPESGERLLAGRAENWRESYLGALADHRDSLRRLVRRPGWSLTVHHTDRPASEPLLTLHALLSAPTDGSFPAGGER